LATQTEVAEHLDLSEQRIRQLLKQGIIPASKGYGQMDLDVSRVAYIRYLRGAATGRVSEQPADLDAAYERARKDAALADKAELEVMERKRLVVPANLIERAWDKMVGGFRSRMLNLAPRVVPLLQACDGTYAEMRRVLDEAVYDSLEELSGYRERVGEPVANGEGREAAAEADGEPVGRPVSPSKS